MTGTEHEGASGVEGSVVSKSLSTSNCGRSISPMLTRDIAVQCCLPTNSLDLVELEETAVLMVRVRLLQSIQLLPRQSSIVPVQIDCSHLSTSTVLLENDPAMEAITGLKVTDALLDAAGTGPAHLLVSNHTGFTQKIEKGIVFGEAVMATVVVPGKHDTTGAMVEDKFDLVQTISLSSGHVFRVTDELREECRRNKILELIGEPDLLPVEKQRLLDFLAESHEAFSLDEGERGETDLVEIFIDTGNTQPLKQPPRRMPFSVRQEVARQLRDMQQSGVIEPSSSPWASPVVLVQK